VSTKYGTVKTDHILFICSGAFHLAKPSDLIPRCKPLPIRVELDALTAEDSCASSPIPKRRSRPIHALLETEGVRLQFSPTACGVSLKSRSR